MIGELHCQRDEKKLNLCAKMEFAVENTEPETTNFALTIDQQILLTLFLPRPELVMPTEATAELSKNTHWSTSAAL